MSKNLSDRITKKEQSSEPKGSGSQANNPLHGIRLDTILNELHALYEWKGLAAEVNINCFKSNPTMKSSLKFLRKTPWARAKVEKLYLEVFGGIN